MGHSPRHENSTMRKLSPSQPLRGRLRALRSASRSAADVRFPLRLEPLEDRLAPALSVPQITTLGYLPPEYATKGIAFTTDQADFVSWDLYVNGTQVLANQPPDSSREGRGGRYEFTRDPLASFNLFSSFVVKTRNGTEEATSAPKVGPNAFSSPTIVLPTVDWAAPPAGVAGQRITPDAQVASLLLDANQTYRFPLQDWVGVFPQRVATPQFSFQTNRPGVVDLAIDSDYNLVIDTSPLRGQAGITSIRLTDTAESTSIGRTLGIQVRDVAGNPPSSPSYLGIGAVNDSTTPDFFLTNVLNTTTTPYQQYDYQYVYLNNGPTVAPRWQGSQPSPTDPLVDNTAYSWRTSSGGPDGKKLFQLLGTAAQLGSVPTVVYYNIMCGFTQTGVPAGESSAIGLANLKNQAFMLAYFQDLKFTLDTMRQFANGGTAALILEPDFLAYMMKSTFQSGTWADPSSIVLGYDVGAVAAQAGLLPAGSSTGAGSTLVDWVRTINSGVRHLSQATVGGQVQSVRIDLGWKFNLWAADFAMPDGTGWGKGISKVTDWFLAHPTWSFQGATGFAAGVLFVKDIATKTARWYRSAGILDVLPSAQTGGTPLQGGGMSFMAIDKYGIDGGNSEAELTSPGFQDPAATSWFFNADHWANYVTYAAQIRSVLSADLPIWLWQIPVGHINTSTSTNPYTSATYVPLANSYYTVGATRFGQWEDSAVTYVFGDSFTGMTDRLTPGQNQARRDFFSTNHAQDPLITLQGDVITWGSHIDQLWAAGVRAILFGPGLPEATMGGGYAAQLPKDDFFWATKSQEYLVHTSRLAGGGRVGMPLGDNVQVPVTGSPDERLVMHLYQDLLGRPAEPEGLAFWTNQLAQGMHRDQVAFGIVNSPEYRTRLLEGMYASLLGRPSDPEGLSFFLQRLAAGESADQARALFLASPEYYRTRGQGADAIWLRVLYRDALGRAVDPLGAETWSRLLGQGMSRWDVATQVLASEEDDRAAVEDAYIHLLGRDAERGGMAYFLAGLHHGLSEEEVLALVAGSAEYSTRVGAGTPSRPREDSMLSNPFASAPDRNAFLATEELPAGPAVR